MHPRNVKFVHVNINNKLLPLPLPYSAERWSPEDHSDKQEAFPNQFQILYGMLNGAFVNWANETSKPVHAIRAINLGSEESRLHIEWIYQVLNNPKIIDLFLASDPPPQKEKKEFINALYDTAYRQRIILVNGAELEEMPVTESSDILTELFKTAIQRRFQHYNAEINGENIPISSTKFLEMFPDDVVAGAALFDDLVEELTDKPEELPFSEYACYFDNNPRLLVLGLNECQVQPFKETGVQEQ